MTIEQATLLDDRYRLDERIGTGGTADVFRATDELLNREVAVKVLRELSDPTARARFTGEARTLAGLNHPGLVTLLDAGILGDRPYLVMTLADDATLSSRIAVGPLDAPAVKDLGIQIARALAYAHDRGVVHRDVKPSNVLLCGDGRALLADFGIARLIGDTEHHHTRTGDAIGSPAYLAPEQVAGEEVTPAADVYALGLVLLEAITAQRAFPGSAVEAAVARLNAAPPMPTSLDPGWRALLARMTHRDPANRPTAEAVAIELETAAVLEEAPQVTDFAEPDPEATAQFAAVTMESPFHSDGPVGREATYDVEPPLPVPTGRRGRRGLVVAAALVIIVLAVVAALVVVLRGGGRTPQVQPGNDAPTDVPSKLQQPLGDLHEAVHSEAR